MRRSLIGLLVIALIGVGTLAVFAIQKYRSCSETEVKSKPDPERLSGAVTGKFDPVMSGACRFACATKVEYDAADVVAQPGAQAGKLTQCPVSGVVFMVDAKRHHVRITGREYVACCGNCAAKLQKAPAQYWKA